MNVRLVCRLRKSSPVRSPVGQLSSSENSAMPTPPTDVSAVESSVSPLPAGTLDITEPVSSDQEETQLQKPSSSQTVLRSTKDRYFIMKSLTKEDLAWSVTNKVWATQPHNEATLNDAFRVNIINRSQLICRIQRTCFSFSVSIRAAGFLVTQRWLLR